MAANLCPEILWVKLHRRIKKFSVRNQENDFYKTRKTAWLLNFRRDSVR
jgi:hypothetical protein